MLAKREAASVARLVAGQSPTPDPYDVDIIILALDRLAETMKAIHSALAQRGVSLHVIVLDQGSSPDTTEALIKAYGRKKNIAIYRSSTNLGVASGRNVASEFGHGRIIVALDNDAIFQGEWVAAGACRAFRRRPELGALGFNILAADGEHPDLGSWGYPAPLLSRFRDRFDTTTFVGAGHAIRRVTWQAVGGYDSTFFFTWEEYDFCLSAIALKWRVGYDGALAVVHQVSPTARVSWDDARLTYFVRNRLMISRKWGATRLQLLPRMAAYVVRGAISRRLTATIAGLRAAWLAEPPPRRRMSAEMREYLHLNETRHRGSWFRQLLHEITRRRPTDLSKSYSARG
jgi:GT2 family glycosyltransferase